MSRLYNEKGVMLFVNCMFGGLLISWQWQSHGIGFDDITTGGKFHDLFPFFTGLNFINIAYEKPTALSSVVKAAKLATDGIPRTSAKTRAESQNWIKVDLEDEYDIYAIIYQNSKGRKFSSKQATKLYC